MTAATSPQHGPCAHSPPPPPPPRLLTDIPFILNMASYSRVVKGEREKAHQPALETYVPSDGVINYSPAAEQHAGCSNGLDLKISRPSGNSCN